LSSDGNVAALEVFIGRREGLDEGLGEDIGEDAVEVSDEGSDDEGDEDGGEGSGGDMLTATLIASWEENESDATSECLGEEKEMQSVRSRLSVEQVVAGDRS
jgi:hypothetical protein